MRHTSRHARLRAKAAERHDRRRNAPARPTPPGISDLRANQAHRNETAFRELVAYGWDGTLVLDPRGRVRFMNDAAKELFGPQAELLIGANFGLPAVGRHGVEVEIARAPGDDRIAEMRVVEGPWNGEQARIVLVRDVTVTRTADNGDTSPDRALDAIAKIIADAESSTASAAHLSQRLCDTILRLCESTESHVYLTSNAGDLLPTAQAGTKARLGSRPDRLSLVEIEGLQNETFDAAIIGLATGAGHPFAVRTAARMGLGWLLVTPLRHQGRLIGIQMTGGPSSGPRVATRKILQEASRVAGLAIGSALLRDEIRHLKRSRSEILSTVSHELRSPLHVILGYGDLLREGGLGELSREQNDAVVRIGRNARQLADLIENTLTAGRENAASSQGSAREVRPCDVINEIREEMASLYGDNPVALSWNVPEDLPHICTDADKLKIVVRNLVANALKFTDRGSVEVAAERRDDGLAITVTDTGVGIPDEHLDTIFDEFRQVTTADTEARGGVGLGLYIVQRMTENLDGRVSVTSEVGQGSTFTIWIPLRVRPVHAAA